MPNCKYKTGCPLRPLYGCEIVDCSGYRLEQVALELQAKQSRTDEQGLDTLALETSA